MRRKSIAVIFSAMTQNNEGLSMSKNDGYHKGVRTVVRAVIWVSILLCTSLLYVSSESAVAGGEPAGAAVRTAGGETEDVSIYLPTPGGARLAVDRYLPPDYKGGKLPTLVYMTRYWRAVEYTPLGEKLIRLGKMPNELGPDEPFAPDFLRAQFAIVAVDSLGTGASEGRWTIPFGPKEISDLNSVFNWIVKQPWSNGRIGTYGISYPGFTAELAATVHNPALKAVAPLFVYWDVTRDALDEGGVRNDWFIHAWSDFTVGLDHNNPSCSSGGPDCKRRAMLLAGVKPVDSHLETLAWIMKTRHNVPFVDVAGCYQFRHDKCDHSKLSMDDVGPSHFAAQLSQSGVAYFVMTGWYDQDGAASPIRRYLDQTNPQDVLIGPWSHGGRWDTDPYSAKSPAPMTLKQITYRLIEFFNMYLRNPYNDQGRDIRRISYYVNGAGIWRTTASWPPVGYPIHQWYFATAGALVESRPEVAVGADRYLVNFNATTGPENRYRTVMGGRPVVYPDRTSEDELDLTYTSAPLQNNMEITGTPSAYIQMSSSTSDGAVYVYLEDVAPSGHVTYLTEGILRLIDRKVANIQNLSGVLGPQHSFLRSDTEPMPIGKPVAVQVALDPISAVVRKGHRIRISIAGFDASNFQRIPEHGDPVFTIERNRNEASFVGIPMTQFNPAGGDPQPLSP